MKPPGAPGGSGLSDVVRWSPSILKWLQFCCLQAVAAALLFAGLCANRFAPLNHASAAAGTKRAVWHGVSPHCLLATPRCAMYMDGINIVWHV